MGSRTPVEACEKRGRRETLALTAMTIWGSTYPLRWLFGWGTGTDYLLSIPLALSSLVAACGVAHYPVGRLTIVGAARSCAIVRASVGKAAPIGVLVCSGLLATLANPEGGGSPGYALAQCVAFLAMYLIILLNGASARGLLLILQRISCVTAFLGWGSYLTGLGAGSFSPMRNPSFAVAVLACPVLAPLNGGILGACLAIGGLLAVFFTGQRMPFLAAVVGLAVFGWLLRRGRSTKIIAIGLGVIMASAALAAAQGYSVRRGRDLVVSDVLLWDDKYRGFDSGFSGRFQLVEIAFELFLEKPLFGHGARANERYIIDYGLPHPGSVDNGYLVVLVDYGAWGAAWSLAIIALSCLRLYRNRNLDVLTYAACMAVIVAVLMLAIGGRFLFNLTTPISIAFILVCSWGLQLPWGVRGGRSRAARCLGDAKRVETKGMVQVRRPLQRLGV